MGTTESAEGRGISCRAYALVRDAAGCLFFEYETFDLHLGMSTEVHEKPQLHTSRFEVINHLSAVLIRNGLNGFEFDNYFIKADKVRDISLLKLSPLIAQTEHWLFPVWNARHFKFNRETFLKYIFEKPVTLVLIDFKTSTSYPVTFFSKQQFMHLKDTFRVIQRLP